MKQPKYKVIKYEFTNGRTAYKVKERRCFGLFWCEPKDCRLQTTPIWSHRNREYLGGLFDSKEEVMQALEVVEKSPYRKSSVDIYRVNGEVVEL